ncbi:hypothetical protein EST38_g4744 [Candolleomyces aberdarensis]|uniref:DUF7330 domain-containing protein n=1 Tax=Candolleomyces aberdarensis TaxID=2316362 RepID=A0A4Q2DP53_9AGAR|nr:hypothetical protein EST38_g4744 [Candolleomyces aberdarensis]
MSSENHSTYSSEKSSLALLGDRTPRRGTTKVKYHGDSDWDFYLDSNNEPIDLSLIMPHYRARHQPVDHRMSMYAGSESEPIKLKVCRTISRSRFYLEVQGSMSDVTIWLPSDFKGHIHHTGKAVFSAGFVNRIMRNVRLNEPARNPNEDEVVVVTQGQVILKMWDVTTCSPENCTKEGLKRIFGCSKRAPETGIDWDCLLRD